VHWLIRDVVVAVWCGLNRIPTKPTADTNSQVTGQYIYSFCGVSEITSIPHVPLPVDAGAGALDLHAPGIGSEAIRHRARTVSEALGCALVVEVIVAGCTGHLIPHRDQVVAPVIPSEWRGHFLVLLYDT
jgi:hypothetical protein